MPLSIKLGELSSRTVRAAIGDTTGIRRFAKDAIISKPDSNGNNLNIWNGLASFGNTLLTTFWERLQTGTLTFTKIVSFIFSGVNYVMNFNWNMGLEDANRNLQNGLNSLSGTLGSLLGTAVGYLACGALPGVILFSFNEALALYVLKEVGEEALDELAGQAASLVRQGFSLAIKGMIEYGYVGIKGGAAFGFNSILDAYYEVNGVNKEKLVKAKEVKKKPWSFSSAIEDAVESIEPQALENFVENFLEEAFDSCVEAGYVVANALDSQMMASQMANQSALGTNETVELIFNRNSTNQPANQQP